VIYSAVFAVAAIMNQRMAKLFSVGAVAVGVLAACGSKASGPELHAVGTYIGGGSIMFGSDPCTYAGSAPGVFEGGDKPATEAARGPRYVTGAGMITQDCEGRKTQVQTVAATSVNISGPAAVKAGTESESNYSGTLMANGKELDGEPYLDWGLGPDCNGIAEFGPVMGSQDTGGSDRTRKLVTKGKGTCTVLLTATTGGSTNYPDFKGGATFQAQKKVTIN
jgi:hypothetical protein